MSVLSPHTFISVHIAAPSYYTWWQSWLSKEVCRNCFDIISICNANPVSLCSCGDGECVTFVYVRMLCGVRIVSLSRLRCNLKRIYLLLYISLLAILNVHGCCNFLSFDINTLSLLYQTPFDVLSAGRERKGVDGGTYVYVNRNMHLSRTQSRIEFLHGKREM